MRRSPSRRSTSGTRSATRTKFIATSITLEDTGVSAYDGQGPLLRRKTLPAAAAIVSVEARHAAWIRYLAGQFGQDAVGGPAPDVLNPALTKDQVTAAVDRDRLHHGLGDDMTNETLTLEAVDADGAIRELAAEAAGDTARASWPRPGCSAAARSG